MTKLKKYAMIRSMYSDITNDLKIIEYPHISPDTELTSELLIKYIEEFNNVTAKKFNQNNDYYIGKNKDLRHSISNDAPDNQINIAYARKLVITIKGYMFKPGNIKYIPESSEVIPDELIKEYYSKISEIFKNNNESLVSSELGEDQSKYGVGYEIVYFDKNDNNKIKFKRLKPDEVLPIYSNDLDERLLYCLRITKRNEKTSDIELYTATNIYYYEYENGKLNKKDLESVNVFGEVPVVQYKNNNEYMADYEPIAALICLYDKLYSDSANELDRFAAAYLILKNFIMGANEEETAQNLSKVKKLRVFEVDADGDIKFLTKEIPVNFFKEIKDSVQREIIKQSQIPDFTDESFNTASGIAIKYKLIDLENLCSFKEAYFKVGLFQRLKLINTYLKIKEDININDYIDIVFTRNIADNLIEISDIVSKLNGIISKETLLTLLPFIKDVEKELEKIEDDAEKENAKFDIDKMEIKSKPEENSKQPEENEAEPEESNEKEEPINE